MMQNPQNENPTIEDNLQSMAEDVRSKVVETYEKYEKIAQHSPGKTVLLALASGYCLHRLPVRALVVMQVRIAIALAPPMLLALGAAKLSGLLQRPPKANSGGSPIIRP